MNHVIIGVGSNINPEENTEKATRLIKETFQLLAVSKFRETKPVGGKQQANFLNGAVAIQTTLNAKQLKERLRAIEDQLKRERHNRQGPRTIDLDIMVWNGQIVDEDVPQRPFLQQSILDLMPEMQFPA